MKLLNLMSLNNLIRKHISTVLFGLFAIMKKNNSTILILSIIISLFGSNLFKNFCNHNISDNESQSSSYGTNESDKEWTFVLKNKLGNCLGQNDNKSFEFDDIDNIHNDFLENHNLSNNKNACIPKKKSKIINKCVDKFNTRSWYKNTKDHLSKNYYIDEPTCDYTLTVTEENKDLLIYNLRTYSNIDFYFKLCIADYNSKKLNQLIMLRDIQNWMYNSTITNEEFDNTVIPVYLIYKDHKTNNEIMIFEIYKIFFYEKEEGKKQCFVSKGEHYVAVEEILNILFQFNYIQNLCNGKDYDTYDLSNRDELCNFLDKLLSGCTLQNNNKGDNVYLDMNQKIDNMKTFEYFYEVLNSDQITKDIDGNNESIDNINKKICFQETTPDSNKNMDDEFKEELDALLSESAKSTPCWIRMLTTI